MPPVPWLPRLLFRLTLAVAASLISLVLLCPLLDNGRVPVDSLSRLAALFARDAAVRRTAVASALGLAVTACVFFRGPRRQPRPPKPPPPRVVGA